MRAPVEQGTTQRVVVASGHLVPDGRTHDSLCSDGDLLSIDLVSHWMLSTEVKQGTRTFWSFSLHSARKASALDFASGLSLKRTMCVMAMSSIDVERRKRERQWAAADLPKENEVGPTGEGDY